MSNEKMSDAPSSTAPSTTAPGTSVPSTTAESTSIPSTYPPVPEEILRALRGKVGPAESCTVAQGNLVCGGRPVTPDSPVR